MRIVKLQGGLGNQLFQYAFGKALGNDVKFDVSWFSKGNRFKNNIIHLVPGISDINADLNIASEKEVEECLNESPLMKWLLPVYKRYGIKLLKTNRVYERVKNKFYQDFFALKGDVFFDGYFQNPCYFNSFRGELIQELNNGVKLSDKNRSLCEEMRKSNSVAVSVRHAYDYEKLGWALSADYYKYAMAYLSERYENLVYYVFSDNLDWCRKNLRKDVNIRFCESKDEISSYAGGIFLLSNGKHSILANSTYSWWGAYLNKNFDGNFIMPKGWVPRKHPTKTTYSNLFLPNWICL